jgi:hypothetical protein
MNRSRLFSLFIILLIALKAEAAPMQRLVRVADATTLVVERDGFQTAVALAGVDVPPARRAETIAYLETMVGSWVLVENGNVYRSPDGAFVNAEVRRRLAANAAPAVELHPMTVLGIAAPGPERSEPAHAPEKRAAKPRAPRRQSPAHRKWRAGK